jgi:quercetin dioxygenase-like cupin family protein
MSQLALPQLDASPAAATTLVPLPTGLGADRDTDLASGLSRIARELAAQREVWHPLLELNMENRWYMRLATGDGWEAWLLTWWTGQGTDLHDHGGAAGAFTVLSGELQELTPVAPNGTRAAGLSPRTLSTGEVRTFDPNHIHQVINVGDRAAASLHVYAPALTLMNRYHLDPERGPVLAVTERAGRDW